MITEIEITEKPNFQVPNLERGLQVLEYLVENEASITLNVLAKKLGFPVNSLLRVMNALEYYGYVQRDVSTKEYTLSRKMFSMGYSSPSVNNLMENSLDVMRNLRDDIGETVVVSIIDGNEGLVLEQVQGRHPFRFVCDPGTRQALHCSASCKAILAFMPEAELDGIVSGILFARFTDTTIISKEDFLKELSSVRRLGYALDRAEAIEGVHCVASPVLDRRGNAVAAITITGPANRITLQGMSRIGETVKNYALKISERMGYIP